MLFNFCLILALYDISHAYYGRKTTYDCQDKQDDGYYEHEDCHKYWHCLYVGTIFQNALERKCPIGTMFHPLQGECEISTFLSCKLWRKRIYGPGYVDPSETTTTTTIETPMIETTSEIITQKNTFTSLKDNTTISTTKPFTSININSTFIILNLLKNNTTSKPNILLKLKDISLKTLLSNKVNSKNFTVLASNGKKTIYVPSVQLTKSTQAPQNTTILSQNQLDLLKNLFLHLASKKQESHEQIQNLFKDVKQQTESSNGRFVNEDTTKSLTTNINNFANIFEVTESQSNDVKMGELLNDNFEDDTLIFDQNDLSLLDADFLFDNLRLNKQEQQNTTNENSNTIDNLLQLKSHACNLISTFWSLLSVSIIFIRV